MSEEHGFLKWLWTPFAAIAGWMSTILFLHNRRLMDIPNRSEVREEIQGAIKPVEQKLDAHISDEAQDVHRITTDVRAIADAIGRLEKKLG